MIARFEPSSLDRLAVVPDNLGLVLISDFVLN